MIFNAKQNEFPTVSHNIRPLNKSSRLMNEVTNVLRDTTQVKNVICITDINFLVFLNYTCSKIKKLKKIFGNW